MTKQKKIRIAAAIALTIALIAMWLYDNSSTTRATLRAQCDADAATASEHALSWQKAASQTSIEEALQKHISDPALLGFSPAGQKMLKYLATHQRQWSSFQSETPEKYQPIFYAACLTAN